MPLGSSASAPEKLTEPIQQDSRVDERECEETAQSGSSQVGLQKPGLVDGQIIHEQQWIDLFPQFGVTGITGNILANCVFRSFSSGNLTLLLDRNQSAIFNEEHRKRIEDVLGSYFNMALNVSIDIGELDKESPGAHKHRIKLSRIEAMQNQFAEDKNVKQLLEKFSGEIIFDSISPIE